MTDRGVWLERRWLYDPASRYVEPAVLTFHLAGADGSETVAHEPTRGFEPVATPWDELTNFFQCERCLKALNESN
jgi:hypothetical protein